MRKKEQEGIFNNWVDQFKPLLFKIVRIYGTEYNNEDDLFQEIIVQLWKSVPNFKKQCSEHTWIYRVALNTAIKWSSRSKKIKVEEISNLTNLLQKNEEIHPKLDWLYTEIEQLDPVDRSLTLLMLDGFSYHEMSEIIGISSSNVGVKISRIKTKLKERAKSLEHEY